MILKDLLCETLAKKKSKDARYLTPVLTTKLNQAIVDIRLRPWCATAPPILRLELVIINLPTKFEVSTSLVMKT